MEGRENMGTDTLEQFTLFDMEEEIVIKEGEDVQQSLHYFPYGERTAGICAMLGE